MPTPEVIDGFTPQLVNRVNNALALEVLLEGIVTLDQPILAADIELILEDRIRGGNKHVLELLGRPPRRFRLYSLLGDLVMLDHARDSDEGMVFNKQTA